MELRVIASSSEGNAYALISDAGQILLLEAGVSFGKVKEAIDYKLIDVVGCLMTHEHGDHAGHVGEVLKDGVTVYTSPGTAKAINDRLKLTDADYKPRIIGKIAADRYYTVRLGDFEVTPFATKHDAAEAIGFYIWHPESKGILFATDTYYLPNTFDELGQVMIECNYDPEILAQSVAIGRDGMDWQRAERVRASHLSLPTCLGALKANNLTEVNNVVLIHVSRTNGDPQAFKEAVETTIGIPTHIARPGLKVNFNNDTF